MAQFFGFSCRKWTIIVLCSFLIVAKIIELITIFSHKNEIVPKNDDKTIIALVVYEIITIATILIGLFGALKENYCLSFTYSIFSFSNSSLIALASSTAGINSNNSLFNNACSNELSSL